MSEVSVVCCIIVARSGNPFPVLFATCLANFISYENFANFESKEAKGESDEKAIACAPSLRGRLIIAAPAHAFTFESNSPSSGGSAIVDPDQQRDPGKTTTQQGGVRFHFGPSSGRSSQSNSPPAWSRDPLFLDKGSSRSDQ